MEKERNKHKALYYILKTLSYLVLVVPFFILSAVYWKEWYHIKGKFMGPGARLMLVIACISILAVFNKKEKHNLLWVGWINIVVFWYAIAFLTLFVERGTNSLFEMMMWQGAAFLPSILLDSFADLEKQESKEPQQKERQKKEKKVKIKEPETEVEERPYE